MLIIHACYTYFYRKLRPFRMLIIIDFYYLTNIIKNLNIIIILNQNILCMKIILKIIIN